MYAYGLGEKERMEGKFPSGRVHPRGSLAFNQRIRFIFRHPAWNNMWRQGTMGAKANSGEVKS